MVILVIFVLCLVAVSNAAVVEKRNVGSKAPTFTPSQPFPEDDFIEMELHSTDVISEKSDSDLASRSSDSKAAGKEDPQGNMYYYYYPSANGGSEDRDGSVTNLASNDPIDATASGSSVGDSSYTGHSGSSVGSYGPPPMVSGGKRKDTSHFLKIALPLFLLGSLLLGLSNLAYPSQRSLEDGPFFFIRKWEQDLQKIFDNYMDVLESEQCLQRTVCEAGHFAKDYSVTKYILPVLEIFTPKMMLNNTKIFKSAIQDNRDMSSCKKYKCNYQKKH